MSAIIFREPRTLTPQDRIANFRMLAARIGWFVPNAYRWKWVRA